MSQGMAGKGRKVRRAIGREVQQRCSSTPCNRTDADKRASLCANIPTPLVVYFSTPSHLQTTLEVRQLKL